MTRNEEESKRDLTSVEPRRSLVEAYGGHLVSLATFGEEREELASRALELPSVRLGPRELSDLELLATGAFSPLDRFMCSRERQSVVERGRLAEGTLFPVPVLLPLGRSGVRLDQEVALRNVNNNLIAWMRIEDIFECEPDVPGRCCVSGELRVIDLPVHYDFPDLRLTPADVREQLLALANPRVIACQPLQPMHRAEEEMTKRAAEGSDATLLIQPVVGVTRASNIDHYTRVRTYRTLVQRYYNLQHTLLGLLPLSLPDGSLEATLLQMIVARNYGSSHFLVHSSLGHAEAAQELLKSRAVELGVTAVVGDDIVYLPELECYSPKAVVAPSARVWSLPASEAKEQYLDKGRSLPEWFTRRETAEILAGAHPPRERQGLCVWFTGLPCSGKSTTAEVLASMLFEQGRRVTLLDGDVVRTHLSRGLGFSREDRDTNILRIGFVAAEIVRHHGAVICAAVSPYRSTRDQVRTMVGSGNFVEVFVNTPLNVCEQRDVKGFYARARAGHLKGFTGVDDPYEAPEAAEVEIDTVAVSPAQTARAVFEYVRSRGFLAADAGDETLSPL